ncbi:MAG: hypothetical protein ACYSSL_03900 [Planctomycetota bacterium]
MAEKTSITVPLNWKEVFYTNCPMVSANNIDQELLEERWEKVTTAKLPEPTSLRLG